MNIKITPNKLDGEINASGLYAEYLNGASLVGNRIKVNGNKDIVKYLLSYNAKGTSFDLTEKEDYVPILALCATFACSDTKITATGDIVEKTVNAINDVNGYAEITDFGLIIHGKDSLKGGIVQVADARIALALALTLTCAENNSQINGIECLEQIAPNFFEDFVCLGGQYQEL